jgi:hypothetical protein
MEETTPSSEYLKGFNEGYILAKDNSELAEKLSKTKSNSERLLGFQDGHKTYVLEKLKKLRPTRLKDIASKNLHSRDKSKGMDMDI